ncbi:52 kDa repressor of the inhibitor of the protein kinase [Frankliniella fusca]|uniref:52 kDa repressor of the inhibitor of the protein kinase n=1 Tax=Frankliniella fusca TaxID=407009 RepID=A0AAE1LEV9_9NEOP|nr:52 kDa repressor of the inhibitor of the protein kinase [Frankliniella fusca]
MGVDISQWRAAIGRHRHREPGASPSECECTYPSRAPSTEDPLDVRKVVNKHYNFFYLAAVVLPISMVKRKQFFNALVTRLLLLAAGIEANPGPSNSSTSKGNLPQAKRLKTLHNFFKVASVTDPGVAAAASSFPSGSSVSVELSSASSQPTTVAVASPTSPSTADCTSTATVVTSLSSSTAVKVTSVNKSKHISGDSCENEEDLHIPSTVQVHGHVANDIGNFIGQKISDLQKRELLLNPWQPPVGYNFPYSTFTFKGKEYKRHLSQKHLDTYRSWLVLSHIARGLFCKYCPWFAVGGVGGQHKNVPLTKLVTEPLIVFKDLLGNQKNSVLANHEQHMYHKIAVEKAKNFLSTYDNPAGDVVNQVNEQRLAQIQENRDRLVPIVRATLFLGKQGLAFRGHRDDGQLLSETEENNRESLTGNEGNFRETLKLMVASGDSKLQEHLKNASSRATDISKTVQNELIKCIGAEIFDKILLRLHKTLFYSILFDETTDVSHKSQLSLVLRYVTADGVYEDFISFVDAFVDLDNAKEDGTYDSEEDEWDEALRAAKNDEKDREIKLTGKAIAQIVLRLLNKLGLSLHKCVGIGTDGCSVMTSDLHGAVAEIQKHAKNALRTPCFNHKLNLSISQSNKITCIRNAVGTMKECVKFFDVYAKRNRTLHKYLGHNLSALCETRWIERHDGVLQYSVDLPKILQALESIETWNDSSTSSKAAVLRAALKDTFFLVSVMCLSDILALTLPLRKLFQKPSLNLDTACNMISNLIDVLTKRREKAEEQFKEIWKKIVDLAEVVDAHLVLPRRCGRQGNRANYSTDCPETYFRQAVFIPLLDQVLIDIRERFPPSVVDCFQLPLLLPANIVGISASDLEPKAKLLASKFDGLLPNEVELSEKLLYGELTMWREKWISKNLLEIPEPSVEVIGNCDSDAFPLIHTLITLLTTLPVSNASAERSFSALRRLKSWLRSTMSQDRLTGLALMHVHRDIDIDINAIITRFAKSGNRRLELIL